MANPTPAVELTLDMICTARETLGSGVLASVASGAKITHSQFNVSKSLNGTTSQPVSKVVSFTKALAAGAATIDLTALTGANGATYDGTGLKVQAILIKPTSTNTGAITFSQGATNAYGLLGATWSLALQAGQAILIDGNELTPDIGASAKNIAMAGTGTESADIEIVMG